MDRIFYDVADNLAQMCFVIHSMQKIYASGSAAKLSGELEAAADLLMKLSEESLNAMRRIL